MRGGDALQEVLFTVANSEDFVPADHPLRSIRMLVNTALGGSGGASSPILFANLHGPAVFRTGDKQFDSIMDHVGKLRSDHEQVPLIVADAALIHRRK